LMSVQATGLGASSAAAVVEELAGLGARVLVRLGVGRALDAGLEAGAIVWVSEARAGDGTSVAMGARGAVCPDPALTRMLALETGGAGVAVMSSDLFYDSRPDWSEEGRRAGCMAADLEGAAVLRTATVRGLAAGALLGLTESFERRLDRDETKALGMRLGQMAAAALQDRSADR